MKNYGKFKFKIIQFFSRVGAIETSNLLEDFYKIVELYDCIANKAQNASPLSNENLIGMNVFIDFF